MPRARGEALRALELDPRSAEAHTSLALIYSLYDWEWDQAEAYYRRAIELNPNSSFAHGYVGIVHAFGGAPERALESCREAIRLSPRDLLMVIWRVGEGWAHLAAERFAESAESARLAIDWNPAFVDAHGILAAALAHDGRLSEARVALDECLRRLPGLTAGDPRLVRPFRDAADQRRFIEGLRKAGLPDA